MKKREKQLLLSNKKRGKKVNRTEPKSKETEACKLHVDSIAM